MDPICYILNLDDLFLFRIWGVAMLIIKTGMKHACEACVVLYLAQGSYNIGTLDLACLHYIVTTHATSEL